MNTEIGNVDKSSCLQKMDQFLHVGLVSRCSEYILLVWSLFVQFQYEDLKPATHNLFTNSPKQI